MSPPHHNIDISQGGQHNISAASGKQFLLVAIATLQPAGYRQSYHTFECQIYDVIMSQIISFWRHISLV